MLLASLTTLFKYLLIPRAEDELCSTWKQLCGSLEKCHPDVQRAVAEVWASVLRRLKKQERQLCVKVMVEDADTEMSDFVAWSMTFACKVCQLNQSVVSSLYLCLYEI